MRWWGLVLMVVLVGEPAAWGQLSRVEGAVEQVYRQLPNLPREDGYGGDSRGVRTLLHRLMVYHLQIMGRSPFSRLDWQLTLADYLDANEVMLAQNYPGATLLSSNPYDRDRQVIQGLSRGERQALLGALLSGFGASPEPDRRFVREQLPQPLGATPTPSPTPAPFVIPPAGSADLLR